MTAMLGEMLVGTRREAAAIVHRHPDQIRRRCTPIGTDDDGRSLYDLDAVQAAFSKVPRRFHLTDD